MILDKIESVGIKLAVVEDDLRVEYYLEGVGPVGGGGGPKWPSTKRLIDRNVETTVSRQLNQANDSFVEQTQK